MFQWNVDQDDKVIYIITPVLKRAFLHNALCKYFVLVSRNKDIFCNTIATVASIDTSSQSDLRLQTKEIQSIKTNTIAKVVPKPRANSRLVQPKSVFKRRYVLITKEEGQI